MLHPCEPFRPFILIKVLPMLSSSLTKQTLKISLDYLPDRPAQAAFLSSGEGPAIVMLHGFMGNATCWQPLISQLQQVQPAGRSLRCVALDLLGFGDSEKPALRYDIAKEVAFVRQFVEAQNLEPCYLLGHSFGGWVAAAYTLAYPDAVRGLILAAPAGIRDDSFCGRYDHLRPLMWPTPWVDWALQLAKPWVKRLGNGAAFDQIAWMRAELNAQPAARSFLVDRLRPEDAIDTVEQEIHRITVPTLVMTGDLDETIPLWHSQTYADRIPKARLTILPGADHALPTKYPTLLADCISPWIAQTLLPA
jgi:pimeloyl-ACP methyl ester carboxylesterase